MIRFSDSRSNSHARGQAIVELALVLPLLMLILLGAIDLGRVYFAYVSITNAAREGARYGMEHPTSPAGITARVNQELTGTGITPSSISYACSPHSCASALNGEEITVTVTAPFDVVTSGILPFGDFTLSNHATMAITGGLQ